ncbi:hypothetical protein QOZ80_7BG0585210 [Eleusine coracana subsp. coracana]|nr:hypothetical protein QOZ80_7BG0585210 [Eleusine coracana subsp. coracana]
MAAPPELIDDAISEILIRFPPEEPAYFFRASLVSKSWRRILTDPAFLRRYRRFHGTPPLLGFFHDYSVMVPTPRFFSTMVASPFPAAAFERRPWFALDCRHGRVLLRKIDESDEDDAGIEGNFVVWDPNPITGALADLDKPDNPHTSSAVVVCSVTGCDHRDCNDGPFLVVCVREDRSKVAHACVYSSETGAWGTPVSVQLGAYLYVNSHRGTLVGDEIHFVLGLDVGILSYNLLEHNLSIIDPPDMYYHGYIVLIPMEDGSLGLAGIRNSSLYLWSRKVNAEGVAGWVQCKIIKLQTLLSLDHPCKRGYLIGFAEDASVIFMFTAAGAFIVNLKSGQARKVGKYQSYFYVIPFMTFYTPGCTSGKLPFTEETP